MTKYEEAMLKAYQERTKVIDYRLMRIGIGDGDYPGCLEYIGIQLKQLVTAIEMLEIGTNEMEEK